ncbi:hypothetical protein VTJ04DRAFT_6913 [Mycothermus thermophilus]|uniref:uncharacterized protein n=1 Tax=Humicola insolens TaxID=85995 RepID=UPI0037449D53
MVCPKFHTYGNKKRQEIVKRYLAQPKTPLAPKRPVSRPHQPANLQQNEHIDVLLPFQKSSYEWVTRGLVARSGISSSPITHSGRGKLLRHVSMPSPIRI